MYFVLYQLANFIFNETIYKTGHLLYAEYYYKKEIIFNLEIVKKKGHLNSKNNDMKKIILYTPS